mmetsp:Transcript_11118/g.12727  ORF Transcript_11118/g.12727 Transcript_11118/m.12727 type:complete len:885 (+) Transcript_11118:264-2918(+)
MTSGTDTVRIKSKESRQSASLEEEKKERLLETEFASDTMGSHRENHQTGANDNRHRICVDIMNRKWKLRPNRWANTYAESVSGKFKQPTTSVDSLLFVVQFMFPNLAFAFGNYAGGGFKGGPRKLKHIFEDLPSDKTSRNDVPEKVERFLPASLSSPETSDQERNKIEKILRKMTGDCKMPVIRFLAWFLGKLWRYTFAKIEVSGIVEAQEAFRKAASNGSATVFLPTHRSHIDYLLLSYVCFGFNMPIPYIAAGENLNIPIIGPLLSSAGAFFIRRSMKGDQLYKDTLKEYLAFILNNGHPLEIFIEGGRTRTGIISDPKLGILNMIVSLVRQKKIPDVVFFPVALDYEKVMESEGYAGNLLGMKKQPESLIGLIRASMRIFMKRNHPGAALVNFGKTVSVSEVINEVDQSLQMFGDDEVESTDAVYTLALSGHVVRAQRDASTVTTVGVLATVLLGFSEGDLLLHSPHAALEPRFKWLLRIIKASGAHCAPDLHAIDKKVDWAGLIASGLRILNPIFKRIDVNCHTADSAAKRRLRLRYASGQIIPILAPFSIIATAYESVMMQKISEKSNTCVYVDEILNQAATLANIVLPHIDGAKIDRMTINSAFFSLCTIGAFKVKEKRVVTIPADDRLTIAEMLRTLRVLIAPSIAASYAVSLAFISGEDIEMQEKVVIAKTKSILYSQFDSKSKFSASNSSSSTSTFTTGAADNPASAEGIQKVEIEDSENMMDQLENSKILGQCLPETLSKAELAAAVKHLKSCNLITNYGGSKPGLASELLNRNTLSHSFSCGSFAVEQPPKGSAGKKEKKSTSSDPSAGLMVHSKPKLIAHLQLVKQFIFAEKIAPATDLGETFVYRRSKKTYMKIALAVLLFVASIRLYSKR